MARQQACSGLNKKSVTCSLLLPFSIPRVGCCSSSAVQRILSGDFFCVATCLVCDRMDQGISVVWGQSRSALHWMAGLWSGFVIDTAELNSAVDASNFDMSVLTVVLA